MSIETLTADALDELLADPQLKADYCRTSFFHFISFYLDDTFALDPADYHADMVNALDSVDDMDRYLSIIGFRGSAKSTLLEAFAIWSMINGKHNFIIYIRATMDLAQRSLANIRNEIETNAELRQDFGIVLDDQKAHGFREKWSESQITIGNCTLVAKQRLAKVRGEKFKKARLDLIICDDLEDVKDAETVEKRKKTREWFFTEVLPATKQGSMADHVKVVLIGNLVHRECLMAHLSKAKIVKTLWFAIFKEDGSIAWPGLYPDMDAIEAEKEKVMLAGEGLGAVIWAREYLLKLVDAEDMILQLSDIQYYPDEWLQKKAEAAGVGVDFALSKKQTADFTAFVKAMDVKNEDGERRLMIMKGNVEKRLNFKETITEGVEIHGIMPHGTVFYPEKVMYQESAIEIFEHNGITCHRMTNTSDKKSRISSACYYVKNGRVLFPKEGAQNVINNLLGFGIEEHDDLADAFANVVLGMVKNTGGILFG